jgi:UDP-N-acetylmuramate dehydrogenase
MVGGSVVANAGAYGAQCSDTFVSAEVFDTRDTEHVVRVLHKEQCAFSYHDSLFCHESGRYVVLRATFELSPDTATHLTYKDNRFNLAEFAARNGREPALVDVRNVVLDVREQKGALIMDGRLSYKSAGSFFHMPYVSPEQYAHIVDTARSLDADKEEQLRPWAWGQSDGSFKLAPGFLLEYTEFQKGYVRGAAGISPKHTLSVINVGGACARDIAQLARDMQEKVEEIFGVRLEREVEYIGNVEEK